MIHLKDEVLGLMKATHSALMTLSDIATTLGLSKGKFLVETAVQ